MENIIANKTVFLGMSGGVDSSVCAYLLKNHGFRVVGVYMKNWSDDFGVEGDCPWEKDVEDVKSVCDQLAIEFRSYNFEKEYREKVIEDFFSQYEKGFTPNPDILCNKVIKFDAFLEKCISDGADYIATGHYARVEEKDGIYLLRKGIDPSKDQSYFLSSLNQFQLSKTIFPLGDMLKSEVRTIAKEIGLKVAEKKDSQGICFIGKINVGKFLRENIAYSPGKIIDYETKEELGEHDGVAFYTIGQRQGLKIGGKTPNQLPYFVCSKDTKENILYVCQGNDNPLLLTSKILTDDIDFVIPKEIACELFANTDRLQCAIRYRQKPVDCTINYDEDKLVINFLEKVRAVSPGQSAVVYNGDKVVCRGTILNEISS